MSEPEVSLGAVAPDVASEFPDLRLYWAVTSSLGGKSDAGIKERLRTVAGRVHGAEAIAMRSKPIPWAYRVFFRHIGIDPDQRRVPVEAAVLRRLEHGGFRSFGRVPDALTLATVETGVGVWALDLAAVAGVLEIRAVTEGEAPPLPGGRLVVADERGVVSELFADPLPDRAATAASREVVLYAIAVTGVPDIHVEEALWTAAELLAG